jgi:ribonuclease D
LFQLIENEGQLFEGIISLNRVPRVSFDLEFDRDRHTYGFDLCLMQVGFDNECLIVDPLAIESLQPLFDFFENPEIQKLVHCPGEDLRLLHHLGCYPKNMADTEVIAKLLNYEQTSLAKLLEIKCGIILNKKHQQSNWHLRPLHDEQLKYAADDVLYLPRLYDILYAEAEQKGISAWLEEEQNWLQTVKYTLERKTDFLKPGDKKNLSPWHAYVLNEIFVLRDRIGEKKNKPAYMIMPEDSARSLADGSPEFHLQHLQGLHPSLRHGSASDELKDNILGIFATANKNGLSRTAARQFFSDEEREQYQLQKNRQKWLKDHFWAPIQGRMADQLGAFAARYILSNGWITKWMNGELCWKDLQPAYKQELVKSYAADLHLNFGEIEAYEQEFTQIASE